MQIIHYILLVFILFTTSLHGDMSIIEAFEDELDADPSYIKKSMASSGPEKNLAVTTLEAGPSATIAGCVSAISGDYFESSTDLIVQGAHPLTVGRNYCSSEKKWTFRHLPKLTVVTSKSGNHLRAGLRDDNGSGLIYQLYKNSFPDILKLPQKVFEKGLTNCGAGVISGQTNLRNTSLYVLPYKDKKAYVQTKGCSGRRIFFRRKSFGHSDTVDALLGKFRICEERFPSGVKVNYTYDGDHYLRVISAMNREGKLLSELPVYTLL